MLTGCVVDLTDMPDMSLTLAVVAGFADGPTTLTGLRNLKHKESDRMQVLTTELPKLGVRVIATDDSDSIVIEPIGSRGIPETVIHTYDDHRVAMAFGLVSLVADGLRLDDPTCVAKTWPTYFDELRRSRAAATAARVLPQPR
jgi:3-phosphoshikimate 1-carboxyvinyltransferase